MTTTKQTLTILFACGGLVGCSADVATLDESAESIIGGTAVAAGARGMVQIDSVAGCNGVALRNNWVLTSFLDGCVTPANLATPSTIRVRVGSQVVAADAALVYDVGSMNAVLVHLSAPLTLNGSTTGFRQDVYDGPLNGSVVDCYGYGNNTATGGAGTLRWAPFTASAPNPNRFEIRTNSAGQVPWEGDRGGACFVGAAVAGVTWLCQFGGAPANARCEYQSGAEFRRWTLAAMDDTGPRPNDTRATAFDIGWYSPYEHTVWGTTTGATHDGPTVPCACTSGGDVWYRFYVPTGGAVHYFDTAGSSTDTSLIITDAAGNPVPGDAQNPNPGLCNDDAGCSSGGFTSVFQSRAVGLFQAGTYYVVVGGCSPGRFVLHHQQFYFKGLVSDDQALTPIDAQLVGDSRWTSTLRSGYGRSGGTCGGNGAEASRWFVSCGTASQFFSLCRSDAGGFTRTSSGVNFDPVLRLRSARTWSEVACNDDGATMGGTDCIGLGGDTLPYGSRLNNIVVPRGLNMLYIDERTGNSTPSGSGMSFTLRYTVR